MSSRKSSETKNVEVEPRENDGSRVAMIQDWDSDEEEAVSGTLIQAKAGKDEQHASRDAAMRERETSRENKLSLTRPPSLIRRRKSFISNETGSALERDSGQYLHCLDASCTICGGTSERRRSPPTRGFKIESGGTVLHVYGGETIEIRAGENGEPAQLVIGSSEGTDAGEESLRRRIQRKSSLDPFRIRALQSNEADDDRSSDEGISLEQSARAVIQRRRRRERDPDSASSRASRSSYSSSLFTSRSSGSTKPSTISTRPSSVTSMDYSRITLEGPNGPRTAYLSREQQAELIRRHQQQNLDARLKEQLSRQESGSGYEQRDSSGETRRDLAIPLLQLRQASMPPPPVPRPRSSATSRARPVSIHGYSMAQNDRVPSGPPPSASAYYAYNPPHASPRPSSLHGTEPLPIPPLSYYPSSDYIYSPSPPPPVPSQLDEYLPSYSGPEPWTFATHPDPLIPLNRTILARQRAASIKHLDSGYSDSESQTDSEYERPLSRRRNSRRGPRHMEAAQPSEKSKRAAETSRDLETLDNHNVPAFVRQKHGGEVRPGIDPSQTTRGLQALRREYNRLFRQAEDAARERAAEVQRSLEEDLKGHPTRPKDELALGDANVASEDGSTREGIEPSSAGPVPSLSIDISQDSEQAQAHRPGITDSRKSHNIHSTDPEKATPFNDSDTTVLFISADDFIPQSPLTDQKLEDLQGIDNHVKKNFSSSVTRSPLPSITEPDTASMDMEIAMGTPKADPDLARSQCEDDQTAGSTSVQELNSGAGVRDRRDDSEDDSDDKKSVSSEVSIASSHTSVDSFSALMNLERKIKSHPQSDFHVIDKGSGELDMDKSWQDREAILSKGFGIELSSSRGSLTQPTETILPAAYDVSTSSDGVCNFAVALFCSDQLLKIITCALHDPDIGVLRLSRNLRRLIQQWGHTLAPQSKTFGEQQAARLLRSSNVSSQAVHIVLEQMKHTEERNPAHQQSRKQHSLEAQKPNFDDYLAATEQHSMKARSLDASAGGTSEEGLSPALRDIRDDLLEGETYAMFKSQLLDFAHRPYKARLHEALGARAISQTGNDLNSSALKALSDELSWVPPRLCHTKSEEIVTVLDQLKGLVENQMGETWNWWPLNQRKHPIAANFKRVGWKTPMGLSRYIDLPTEAANNFQEVLSTAPAFLNASSPLSSATSLQNHTSGSTSTASINPTGPSAPPPCYVRNSSSQPRGQTPMNTTYTIPNIAASLQAQNQTSISVPVHSRHVYLCIKTGRNFHISDLAVHNMTFDHEFFSALRSQYLQVRSWLARYFSMWRYDHCEFFKFQKTSINPGVPTQISFPSDNDDYVFDPRPLDLEPPEGPITEKDFYDRFYGSGDPYQFTWSQYQPARMNIRPKTTTRDLGVLPKRKEAIQLDDGKREVFWGLYARERRCFAWVLAYGCLCNVPGMLFFFLWLFQWGHASDLQNASVPIQLSLSLTVCFAALLYESREGNKR